jgi:hypothetical protein
LNTEGGVNESSAIVPCERNNLSRDNLLNSSDNLTADEGGSSPRSDVVDSSDIVLIEKASPKQPTTITYETEKDIKKHQSPSSSTPLLYANNVQSYQHAQSNNEQMQQKSAANLLSSPQSPNFKDFYDENGVKDVKQDFMVINVSEDDSNTNPFFNSISAGTIIVEDQTTGIKGEIDFYYWNVETPVCTRNRTAAPKPFHSHLKIFYKR